MNSAVAVFVKTPGFSSIKTRLAHGIGETKALEFYKHSVSSINEMLTIGIKNSPFSVVPFWAVAESSEQALKQWKNFEIIAQAGDTLGERLHHIYVSLKKRFNVVVLIGADSPQLQFKGIAEVIEIIKAKKSPTAVLGPARDGGFYLFAANFEIPKSVWTSVKYSQRKTMKELKNKLSEFGEIIELEVLSDVDTVDDLRLLQSELANLADRNASQKSLEQWLLAEGYS